MGCYHKYLSALLLLTTCLVFQNQNNLLVNASSESKDDDNTTDDVCGLYMAESSTSVDADVTVWGIYAGVDMPKGGLVGTPDLAINTHNMMGSCAVVDQATNEESKAIATVHIFEEFIWVPYATGGSRDLEKPGRLVSAISGPGFLGAFNAKLTNSMFHHAGAFFRDAIGEEPNVAHPGRGAYTPFYNVSLQTMETITAGSEIFMDYGANWGEESEDDEEEELNRKDFERLDAFVVQMIDFFEKHKEGLERDSTGTAKKEIYEFLKKDVINAAAGGKKGRQIQDILPVNPDDLYDMKEVGALKYSEPNSKRKVDWLKENGLCMDNLVVGASTIEHAGRGAFTKRPIKEGQLVAPVPVLQIPDDSIMNMYKVTKSIDEDGEKYWHRVNDDEIIGKQLLLNYCYGHPESSMLLFPGGSVTNFINHSSEKPNVKLIFSSHKENRLDLLEKTPTEMLDISFLGMIMEIVALRDIERGEEILLDYGTEWEVAWEKHVTAWKESVENGELPNPWPTRAIDLNPIYKEKPYPTTTEEEENSIPENIRQMCFLHKPSTDVEGEQEEWKPREDDTFDDEDLVDCIVLQRTELKDEEDVNYLPYNYTIRATLDDTDIEKEITNVPHNAILFVDKAETGDQFVTQAFRHYIRIPEEIFPDAWKDKKANKTPPPPHDEL